MHLQQSPPVHKRIISGPFPLVFQSSSCASEQAGTAPSARAALPPAEGAAAAWQAEPGAWAAGAGEARRGDELRLPEEGHSGSGAWAGAGREAQRAELAQLRGDLAWLAQRLWAAERARGEDAARLGARIDELATASKCAFADVKRRAWTA